MAEEAGEGGKNTGFRSNVAPAGNPSVAVSRAPRVQTYLRRGAVRSAPGRDCCKRLVVKGKGR